MWNDVNFHLGVALVSWGIAIGMLLGAWWTGGFK